MMKGLQLEFRSRTFRLTEFLRMQAQTLLESGLAPYRRSLGAIQVRFSDVPARQGGPDEKACAIHLALPGRGNLYAEAQGPHPRVALQVALARTRVMLERQVGRSHRSVEVPA